MPPTDGLCTGPVADVCLVVEGTYPYSRGGVSNWIHDLVRGLPDVRFVVAHVGAERGAPNPLCYDLPANVTGVRDYFCRDACRDGVEPAALRRAAGAARARHDVPGGRSRTLAALRRLHLEERVDAALLDDLAHPDLSVDEVLHGRPSFELTTELCDRLAPEASFLQFFWHVRSMHLPLVRLVRAPAPAAAAYHALCTGYAGTLAAVWSRRTGRPLLLTEHGIYTRERSMELSRSGWFRPTGEEDETDSLEGTAPVLRRMWAGYFRALARCAYMQSSRIVSLSDSARARQILDGAPAGRTLVVPNGVDLERLRSLAPPATDAGVARRPLRVGFVGRVVPIKDVITFIRACDMALREVALDVRLIGPIEEDPDYVRRCRRLANDLGRGRAIRFEGPRPMERIYPAIDLLVLTSLSEGQPLVILEAGAAGIPAIATDVGACRELIEGRGTADRRLGPGGIVTRLASPAETAAAIVRMARDPGLRESMGAAAQRRVSIFYRQTDCFATYRDLYGGGTWQASAGGSSA